MKQLLLLLGALLLATSTWAHGGEDHGEAAAATSGAAPTSFSVAALSESFELLLRYESLEAGQPAHLRLFVSDYATNAPIKDATLTITSPEDATLKWVVEPQEPGEYLLEGQFPAKKKYSFAVNVVAGAKADLLLLENIEVGKKLPVAPVPATTAPGLFSSGKTIAALLGAFVLGGGLTFLLLRRRNSAPLSTPAAPAYENHA